MTKAKLSRALDFYKYKTRLSLITAQAFRMLTPNLSTMPVACSRLREGYKFFDKTSWSMALLGSSQ